MARLVLIEPDVQLREALVRMLRDAGHEVEATGSGAEGIASAASASVEIVLFELGLPDMSGLAVCGALRAGSPRPPLLCALSGAQLESDRVAAFEAGADDFIAKPYSMRELLLRIRVLSRRRSRRDESGAIRVGALAVEPQSRRVTVGGGAVPLSRREFDLLLFLASSPERVHTRGELLRRLSSPEGASGRIIDTLVKRVRRKLGPEAPEIVTLRGVGYKLTR